MPLELTLRSEAEPQAVAAVRTALRGFLASSDSPPELVADVLLAVTEACANVVRHAYPHRPGDLLVEATTAADQLVVTVIDHGQSYDQPSPASGLGLGWVLIDRLADQVSRSETDGAKLFEMRFPLAP